MTRHQRCNNAQFINHDIQETLVTFLKTAPDDNITVEMYGFDPHQVSDTSSGHSK